MSFYRCLRVCVYCCFFFMVACSTNRTMDEITNFSKKQLSQKGIVFLKNGNYSNARLYFSQALKRDPKDCQLHFLNALTYQLEGKSGNYRLLDIAASGLRSAIKFCPRDPWPYYYLGLIELQKKNFQKSEALFYQAMKHGSGQESVVFLKGFVKSAQKAGDYSSIDQLINQLEKLDSKSPLIKELKKIRSTIPNRQYPKYPTKSGKGSYPASKASVSKVDKKQILIDAMLIVSRETQTRIRGVNLLNGLQLQYGNTVSVADFTTSSFAKYANPAVRAGFDLTSVSLPSLEYSTLITHAISIPDITYNLNIFNDVNEHDKLLSRPTLLARDGKTSTYFTGNRLIVGVSGLNTGQIESIPIGLTMKVTPTFREDESIDLDIEFGKEQLLASTSGISASNINQVATTAKEDTNTSVNVHIGETVILSAFSEGLDTMEDNRTPGLADLPLIRYLFSGKTKGKRNTSILVLLTPHQQVTFESDENLQQKILNAKDFYEKFPHPVTNFNQILTHLAKSDIYEVFSSFQNDFYNTYLVNKAVDYTSKNIDDY